MNRKRYFELDRMNVLYCLIVVFIHVFGIYTSRLTHTAQQVVFAAFMKNCAFVVQGFMFLSAAKYSLIYKDKKIKYIKFIWSRIKKVVIPYVICVAVYYVVYCFLGYVAEPSLSELGMYIFNGTLSAQFYFVIAILQFYVLLPLWIWVSKKVDSALLVGASFVIYGIWLYNFAGICLFFDRVFITYLPFWAMGLAAGRHYTKFESKTKSNTIALLVFFALMYFVNGFAKNIVYINPVCLEAIHTLYCVSAILLTYVLCSLSHKKLSLVVGGINGLSFHIYLWHCLLLPFIDMGMNKISFSALWQEALFRAGAMYIIIISAALINGIINKRRK